MNKSLYFDSYILTTDGLMINKIIAPFVDNVILHQRAKTLNLCKFGSWKFTRDNFISYAVNLPVALMKRNLNDILVIFSVNMYRFVVVRIKLKYNPEVFIYIYIVHFLCLL